MEQTRQAAMASRDKMAQEASGGSVSSGDGLMEEEAPGEKPQGDEYQEGGHQGEEHQDDEESVKRKTKDTNPVLGGEGSEGYQGFDYLFETTLTAYMDEDAESGRIKRKSVTVYVPMGNEIRINGDYPGTVNSDTQGISFYADVDPGITFPREDASIGEKLESYVTKEEGKESYQERSRVK